MVTHDRTLAPQLTRAQALGLSGEQVAEIQARASRFADVMDLDPGTAEGRFLRAAIAARDVAASPSAPSLEHAEAVLRQIGLRVNDLNSRLNVISGTRIGIFGWGLVGPGVATIDEFRARIRTGGSWLEPFNGFGPDNFLVGQPRFDFAAYRPWIDQRFEANRFAQIDKKLGPNSKFAVGAFIQALGQNPGIEQTLIDLGLRTHIYVGTGVGDIPTIYQINIDYYKAQRRWNRFWAAPQRCAALQAYLALKPEARARHRAEHGVPPEPEQVAVAAEAALRAEQEAEGKAEGQHTDDTYLEEVLDSAREAWESYWAAQSEQLAAYLRESAVLHDVGIQNDVEKEKTRVIKKRLQEMKRLNQKWGIPPEPWAAVSANRIWNIDNVPAAQIAMLGRIHGPSFAPIGACSGFDIALELGVQAIRQNRAQAVVVGMTDPPPHPVLVGAFYDAKVIACDGKASKPLTGLRGTHVSGGSLIWILGDLDAMLARGHRPIGCEILGTGTSSDAFHIITPSKTGPRLAIEQALRDARVEPKDLDTWDLHATATPGDWTEVQNTVEVFGPGPYLTAMKGVFGHGMSVGGGWELTAQHLAMAEGVFPPNGIPAEELNPEINQLSPNIATDRERPFEGKIGGKINMGIGGINGVVISRVWEFDPTVIQLATILGEEAVDIRRRIAAGEIASFFDQHGIERIRYADYRRLTADLTGEK
ncbi:MAG TPA: beta-ketoacyl synthase N-terminal-like domain-containing protein [Candidatus Udaeobacter sp.]|nr:beta-ketoacyl synthase N-terminal-like domain-containing protein [Candidatus Udaeobacter sp.]